MRRLNVARTAISVGLVFALWHMIWVTLVGLGWAGEVLNFILQLHFIEIAVRLAPYHAVTAFWLVAITFCAGSFLGAAFALIWNWLTLGKEPAEEGQERVPASIEQLGRG